MKIYPMIFRFVNISAFTNEFHVDMYLEFPRFSNSKLSDYENYTIVE